MAATGFSLFLVRSGLEFGVSLEVEPEAGLSYLFWVSRLAAMAFSITSILSTRDFLLLARPNRSLSVGSSFSESSDSSDSSSNSTVGPLLPLIAAAFDFGLISG